MTWLKRSTDEALGHLDRAQFAPRGPRRCGRDRAASGARPAPSDRSAVPLSSAWSSSCVAPRRRVPASGRMVTVPSRRRTRISGLLPTTAKPPKSRKNRNGAGLIRRSARYSANGGRANGTEKRWLGTIWKASPAAMYSLAFATAARNAVLGEVGRRRRQLRQGDRRRGMAAAGDPAPPGLAQPRLCRLPCRLGRHVPAADRPAPRGSTRRSRCRRSRTASGRISSASGTPMQVAVLRRQHAPSAAPCRSRDSRPARPPSAADAPARRAASRRSARAGSRAPADRRR